MLCGSTRVRAVVREEYDVELLTARYSSRKMGLLKNNRDLALGKCSLMANHIGIDNKGEECSFMDLGGAVVKEKSIGRN